jgi:TonB family protein
METLAPREFATPDTEPEIHLLLRRDHRDDWRRWRSAAAASVLVHVVLLTVLLLMPESAPNRVYEQPRIIRFTPLYIPTELTQKAPNKGKLSKELTVEAIAPRPVIKAPSPAPPKRVPPPAPLPLPQAAKAEPKPVAVEPPKIEPPKIDLPPQQTEIAKLNPPLPPPPQPPKLALENAAPPPPPAGSNQGKRLGTVLIPNTSVEAAVHDLTTNGTLGGRQSVGDSGTDLGAAGAGLNLPPSAGRPHSNLELRSDPLGVDFRPYMVQVLAAVRRNWFAVYPEAARLGQRGEVVLEFAIAKQGIVTKVIFSTESGAKALDQSAVAAISASNPLPPLPAEFKGDRIVLRMTFMYNMQR